MTRSALGLLVGAIQCTAATLSQHTMILEPVNNLLHVTEVIGIQNSKAALFSIYIPELAVNSATVTVQSDGGEVRTPPLRKTAEPGVFEVSRTAKRPWTRLEIRYSIPMTGTFSGRAFGPGPFWLISRGNVRLLGEALRFHSRQPQSEANLYQLTDAEPGRRFEVFIQTSSGTSEERQPRRGPARIFERLQSLIVLTAAILVTGGTRLYRKRT